MASQVDTDRAPFSGGAHLGQPYSWPHLAAILVVRLFAEWTGNDATCAIIDEALRDDCLRRAIIPSHPQ